MIQGRKEGNILNTIRARFYVARTRVKYVNSDVRKTLRCPKLNYIKPERDRDKSNEPVSSCGLARKKDCLYS